MAYLAVALGGALGALLRHMTTKFAHPFLPVFPLGALISNLIAGLFCGMILSFQRDSAYFSPKTILFLTTGMMGGLSTFSAFSWETVDFLKESKFFLAGLNLFSNLILSLGAVCLGVALAGKLR